jgi:hypothetical protein
MVYVSSMVRVSDMAQLTSLGSLAGAG